MQKDLKAFFRTSKSALAVGMAAAFLLLCEPARATDQLDLSTGLKTLVLLTHKISGPTTVAILFDPSAPQSRADADAIKNSIDAGIGIPGGLKLTGQVVSVADFAKLPDIKVAFLAQGVSPASYEQVYEAASANGVLTISTGLECVKAGKCVLGVVTASRVEIYYSPAAAEAAHIGFVSAFVMLVKQV